MRTFKTYFFSNMQVYNTVLLSIVVMLHITYFIAGSLHFICFPHPLPLATINLTSVPVILFVFTDLQLLHINGQPHN